MPSCLGISVGKNLIKYAKMSKEKNSNQMSIEAYGVKFYDILSQTLSEVIQETKSSEATVCVSLSSEEYENVEVFKSMKPKDRDALLTSEFESICASKNANASALDMRYILAEDPENPSQYKAICMAVSKIELTNLWQALSSTKFESISAIGPTIVNTLKDKGAGQNSIIVNIEDDTKVTIIKNGGISEMIAIPVGMDEVIAKLADKFNSYARAYEACKGVDAYANSDLSLDYEMQSIRDVLMPTLYDLKQRLIISLQPYLDSVQDVYITGTGIIINNIDLYLQEAFPGKHCEILIPYFVNKERNNIKDVLEVNSALAVATYGLNGINKEQDFLASGTYLRGEAKKKKMDPKEIVGNVKNFFEEMNRKTLRPVKSKKRKNAVTFEDEVENLQQLGGSGEYSAPAFEEEIEYYDPISEWLTRAAVSLFVAWLAYTGFSGYVEGRIDDKRMTVESNIARTESEIGNVNEDRNTIQIKADEYKGKTVKLQRIIDSIRLQQERTFDVPNFLSQLMFIIPTDVKVTSVQIGTDDTVVLEAESGKYAQLGYFVSRLKLAGVLKDVEMEVINMSSTIQIKVNGVLP